MKIFYPFVIAVIFLLFLGFSLKNSQIVELRYYFDTVWRAPLVFLLATALITGAILALIACIVPLARQRNEITRLQKRLNSLESMLHKD